MGSKRTCLLVTVVAGLLLISHAAVAEQPTLRIATWNMSWLTDRMPGTGGEGGVPANVYHRNPTDWALVRKYARRLNADVVAFQEVDGVALAKKAFDSGRYSFHLTTEPDVQKPGFAIRKGIRFTRHPDYSDLDIIADRPRRALNLNGAAGLVRSTDGRTSPCWAGKHPKFIDHIVFGGNVRQWPISQSFKVLVYDETDPSFEKKISDHCPQSINVRIR